MTEPTARRYGGADADARRLDRRSRLVLAAKDVFGRAGDRGATVKAICAAAGLTERYFYESFSNTAALLLAIYEEVSEEAHAHYRRVGQVAGPDPTARTRAILTAYYGSILADEKGARLLLIRAPDVSPELKSAWKACRVELGEVLAGSDGVSATQLDADLRTAVASTVRQIAIDWIEDDFPQPLETIVTLALRVTAVLRERQPTSASHA